ncbi:MAG TPA: hypothetical protein VFD82_08775 [Planctomycetota bacterium]|nr:hypothetical protein [Planctomycetota bacterium]
MNKLWSLLVAASWLFVPACGDSAVGTYELDKVELKKTIAAGAEGPPDKAALDTMVGRWSVTLVLKEEGGMRMEMNMPPMDAISTIGTWKLEGDMLTLNFITDGKGDPKTCKYTAGVVTYVDERGGKKVDMLLRKK